MGGTSDFDALLHHTLPTARTGPCSQHGAKLVPVFLNHLQHAFPLATSFWKHSFPSLLPSHGIFLGFSPLSSLDHVSLFYVPQMSVLYRFLLSVFLSSSTDSAQDTSPVSGFDYSTYADDFQSTTTHELLNPMSVTSQMSDKHPVPTYSEEPTLFCPNVILSLCSKVSEGHNITRGRTWRHSSSSHKSHQTPDADAAPPHTSTFPFTFFPALPLSRLLAELL